MKRNLLLASLAIAFSSAVVAAPITYSVSRTIAGGTVVGSVETDGTFGLLSGANILNWSLTLTAPSLAGSSPDVISGTSSIFVGAGLFGSATDLVFDFSAAGAGFALQGSSGNFWCMASAGASCVGEATPAETIGFAEGGGPAVTEARSGRVTLGTASAVPAPATLALVGAALLAAAGATRRRAAA